MQKQCSNTAILVFIRTDYEEARRKWFSNAVSYKRNLSIIRLLNQHAIKVATQAGLPVFVVSGKDQCGNSFGERLSNAMQNIFEEGYEQVIAIGNDCLALAKKHLLDAQNALAEHELVLGPTLDGGAYLIGISKAAFHKEQFQQLPWQQASLLSELCEIVPSDASLALLDTAIDIDTATQFSQQLTGLSANWLKIKLLQLIGVFLKQPFNIFYSFFLTTICFEHFLRGPPSNH